MTPLSFSAFAEQAELFKRLVSSGENVPFNKNEAPFSEEAARHARLLERIEQWAGEVSPDVISPQFKGGRDFAKGEVLRLLREEK